MNSLFSRTGPFVPPNFQLHSTALLCNVLVVGAGGLGCEILKDLAYSGVKKITVIDMDSIDISNLNRQFLFRMKDIGRYKSEVAAEFIMKRYPDVKILPYTSRLESFNSSFYKSFDIVIAGLDNVEARRWLNSMLLSLVTITADGPDFFSMIPFIDGGTEAFRGQARLFLPHFTSCYECSIATLPEQKGFARCTLANIPRIPEHCIAFAREKLWVSLESFESAENYKLYQPKNKMDEFEPHCAKFDADNPEHMSWVFHRAVERANQYNIAGVTYSLTMQVVKNIIPAVASTNAIIAAICVNEAIKIKTFISMNLNNFFMYMGDSGIYSRTFEYEKNPQCPSCGLPSLYEIDKSATLELLIGQIKQDPNFKLKNPSISVNGKPLYMAKMADVYKDNLLLPLSELFEDKSEVGVTDPQVIGKTNIKIRIHFKDGIFPILKVED